MRQDFGIAASVDHADGEGLQGFGQAFDLRAGCSDALEREACDRRWLLRIGGRGGGWRLCHGFKHSVFL